MATREELAREEEIPPNRRLFEMPMVAETRARVRLLQQRPTTWEQFQEAMIARWDLVNPSKVARDKIKKLRQLTSVQDYTKRFLALAAEIDDMSAAERADRYFDGLKPNIQRTLAVQGIDEFSAMLAAAERLEAIEFQQQSRERRQQPYRNQPRVHELEVQEDDEEDPSVNLVLQGKSTQKDNKPPLICYNCQQPGHIARNCPQKRQPNKQWRPKQQQGQRNNQQQGNGQRQ
jgi:hypothetical protein